MTLAGELGRAWENLKTKRSHQFILLGIITLVAIALRFYGLGQWSFWIDEVATIRRAQVHLLESEAVELWRQPPSLLLTAGALQYLGVNEWNARLVPALIGIVTIPLLYLPLRRMAGPGIAIIAVFLLAIAPWHIYWSQNARFYTSLFVLYSLAYLALFFAFEKDRPWLILLSMAFLFLAFRERAIAALLVPVAMSYLLMLKLLPFELPSGYRKRNILIFCLPVIAYLVYTLILFVFGENPPLVAAIRGFWGKPIDDPFRILALTTFNIGVPLASLGFCAGLYLLLDRSRMALYLMIGAVLPPLLLAAANPFFFTVSRYVFISLISWIILGAIAINEIFLRLEGRGMVLGVGIFALLVADAAGSHLMYYQFNHGNRLEWRAALQLVQDRKLDGEAVISTRSLLASYYLNEEVIDLRVLSPKALASIEERTWFVVDSEGLGHSFPGAREWIEVNGELIDFYYLRVRENINLRIYVYDPES
jgi:hypothetical protein